MLDLVIFDCDGVLVDSERLIVEIESAALIDLGWPLSPLEIAERFMGRSESDMMAAVERHIGRPLPEGWLESLHERVKGHFDNHLRPVDGVVEVLDALTIAHCVASSGSHEKMRHSLGRTGLWDRFEGRIFSATEVERGKPAPDLFLHAAAKMGVAPSACLVVEDSPVGVEAGRAAGMRTIGYNAGLIRRERLGMAHQVIDNMRDLLDLM